MDFLEFVREARSCRRFDESVSLTMNDLDWLVDCARLAPSARNAQELRFITIAQGGVCSKLVEISRWASALKDWQGPQEGERATAFIATVMPEKGGELLCYDAGIANQTIQLAAASRGWSSCIILSFDRAKATTLLAVPEGMKLALLIALGVCAEKRVVEEMIPGNSYNYWRDAEGVHHVPKRSLRELIIKRF